MRIPIGFLYAAVLTVFLTGCPNDTVSEPKSIGMEVVPGSGKNIYSRGESLDTSGLKVRISYTDGKSKEAAVLPTEITGFNSVYYNDQLPLTISKDGLTIPYTVKIMGDLLGTWMAGEVPEFLLRDDMTGVHKNAGSVRWSIKDNILEHRWEEDGIPKRYIWSATVIGDTLYVRDPIRRVSGSESLAGEWEFITWYDGSYAKLSITVAGTGETVATRFENTSFDSITGTGTWEETGTEFVRYTFSSLSAAGVGSIDIVEITGSTNETIMPNGEHQVIWYDPDHIGVDDSGFIKAVE